MKRQIGKNTLGSGKKMSVSLRNYERSTHDKSFIFRSTMAPGTLVPFMKEVGLTGDTFDIELEASVLTHPTIGPLFSSFKLQLDVFTADVRLYQGKLHNNALNIGLNMAAIKLPQLRLVSPQLDWTKPLDKQQVNPSCILAYLGIKGAGQRTGNDPQRDFNALPYLMYADVYKNYYANKQETNGIIIHNSGVPKTISLVRANIAGTPITIPQLPTTSSSTMDAGTTLLVTYATTSPGIDNVLVQINGGSLGLREVWNVVTDNGAGQISATNLKLEYIGTQIEAWDYRSAEEDLKPQLLKFPLVNIDTMREDILAATKSTTAFMITSTSSAPYGLALKKEGTVYSATTSQEGLFVKTYQSDIFNNWMRTEWISGASGVNELTKIDTTGGGFTIDTLTLKRKVYNMLNAIAISGGSYDDWLDVNWDEQRASKPETPVYHGGLSKEVVFQEVVSNSATDAEGGQPLGTLAGRGTLGKKHKGGYVRIKVSEPTYVMGIVSITPRIDYSQGNDWDANLITMDDFHKPALDEIGFQDLVTDQMAYWDTGVNPPAVIYKSAGKQPAWINYMTNYNKTFGNFAIQSEQMFMTLNRQYEPDPVTKTIKDLTTYIDPAKYNYAFAYTKRDAQNFWVQIGVNMEVRRKMSAKIMPLG